MSDHQAESDDLAMIREAHAAQPHEFETDLTYCPSSDVPTDQCHTCIVLARLDGQADRVRGEFPKIGIWRTGQSALVSATGGDFGVIGSILSQMRRQVIDGYHAALTTPPGGAS